MPEADRRAERRPAATSCSRSPRGCSPSEGFKNTTVRDIADAAGILSGSLYHHFDSKESMVDEILLDASRTELFGAVRRDPGQRPTTPRAKLEAGGAASPSTRSTSTTARSRSSRTTRPTSATFERFAYLAERNAQSREVWTDAARRGRRGRRAARRPRRRAGLPLHPRHRLGRGALVPPRRRAHATTEVADQYLTILLDGIAT